MIVVFDEVIAIDAGTCHYQLYLPSITLLPVESWRKICKLAAKYGWVNTASVDRLNAFFPTEIAAAKERWKAATEEYKKGYKLPAGHPLAEPYTPIQARTIAATNKRLLAAVKKEKKQLDRLTKFYNIFKGAY